MKLFILFCFLFKLSVTFAGGSGISGGGTGIDVPGKFHVITLLDLAIHSNGFLEKELPNSTGFNPEKATVNKIVYQKATKLSAYKYVQKRLKIWEASSPLLIKRLNEVINSLDFILFDGYLYNDPKEELGGAISKFQNTYPSSRLHRLATYYQHKGSLLSIPLWKKLGKKSRAGLILHEALRLLQISLGMGIDIKAITKLTAKIILNSPDEDEVENINKFLSSYDKILYKFIKESQYYLSLICKNTKNSLGEHFQRDRKLLYKRSCINLEKTFLNKDKFVSEGILYWANRSLGVFCEVKKDQILCESYYQTMDLYHKNKKLFNEEFFGTNHFSEIVSFMQLIDSMLSSILKDLEIVQAQIPLELLKINDNLEILLNKMRSHSIDGWLLRSEKVLHDLKAANETLINLSNKEVTNWFEDEFSQHQKFREGISILLY